MRGLTERRTKAARAPIQPWPSGPLSLLANPLLTLAGPHMDIGNEATVAGVRLCWAELTPKAPGTAHGGTAEHLGADEAHQRVLAPLVVHLAKARPRSVVCRTWRLAAGLGTPQSRAFCMSIPQY